VKLNFFNYTDTQRKNIHREKNYATEIVSSTMAIFRHRENIFSTLWSANVSREKLCGKK